MKNDIKFRIEQIETEYPVETIEYKGIKIWPFIRHALFFTYFNSDESSVKESGKKDNIFFKINRWLWVLRTTTLSVLFNKNKSILFTDDASSELRYIDERLVDIFVIPIFDYEKDVIPIVTKTRKTTFITAFSRYINKDFFSKLANVYLRVKRIDVDHVVNRQILLRIISKLQIEFDIDKYLLTVISFIAVFRMYFRLINPKKIFLICYYCIDRMAASYVAKEMKIPVIELQHGMITSGHFAYNTKVNIEPNPYPDYFFCFGQGFKKFISPFICDTKNIFVIGNYYIDYIKRNKSINKDLFYRKYLRINTQIIITVANQSIFNDVELNFIEKISEFRQDIHFIYIPRTITSKYIGYSHRNISIETELDVYQCMQNSDITSTVFSSCAIESLVFGTPVILINIQNLAKSTYSEFFLPSDAVFYVDTPEEYASYITVAINKDRKQIASNATYYYANDPQKCTRKTFEKLAGDSKYTSQT
jgi:hypothetical protein